MIRTAMIFLAGFSAFAETAATAWAAMLAGGLYSALHAQGWTPVGALEVVFAVLAVIALAATVIAARRRHESRPSRTTIRRSP